MLLTRSINDELMLRIQNFYEQIDDIEEKCKKLLELKATVAPLMSKKPHPGGGVLVFGSMHPPAWAEEYITLEDETNIMGCKKFNAMMLGRLKESVHAALESSHQLVTQLK